MERQPTTISAWVVHGAVSDEEEFASLVTQAMHVPAVCPCGRFAQIAQGILGLVTADTLRYHVGDNPAFPDADYQHYEGGRRAGYTLGSEKAGVEATTSRRCRVAGRGTARDTMRRFSIRTLMALIVISAVGLAALRNANELLAGLMILGAVDVVGIAVLGAIFLLGPQRAWWTGFALFSGAYLVFALWLSPQLSTTNLHDQLRKLMFASVGQALPDTEVASLLVGEQNIKASLANAQATAECQRSSRRVPDKTITKKTGTVDRE